MAVREARMSARGGTCAGAVLLQSLVAALAAARLGRAGCALRANALHAVRDRGRWLCSKVAELWSISFDPLAAAELGPALHATLKFKAADSDKAFCLEAVRGFSTCGDYAALDSVVQRMWERKPGHKTTSLALLIGVGACRRSGKYQQAVEYIM